MLGFARKAGALLTGTFSVEKGLRAGKVLLVVADEALSSRAREEMERQCQRCGVPCIVAGPAERLGTAIGKQSKVVGITKRAFSERLQEIFVEAQRRGGVILEQT